MTDTCFWCAKEITQITKDYQGLCVDWVAIEGDLLALDHAHAPNGNKRVTSEEAIAGLQLIEADLR